MGSHAGATFNAGIAAQPLLPGGHEALLSPATLARCLVGKLIVEDLGAELIRRREVQS